jgi:hypothetical protein
MIEAWQPPYLATVPSWHAPGRAGTKKASRRAPRSGSTGAISTTVSERPKRAVVETCVDAIPYDVVPQES